MASNMASRNICKLEIDLHHNIKASTERALSHTIHSKRRRHKVHFSLLRNKHFPFGCTSRDKKREEQIISEKPKLQKLTKNALHYQKECESASSICPARLS